MRILERVRDEVDEDELEHGDVERHRREPVDDANLDAARFGHVAQLARDLARDIAELEVLDVSGIRRRQPRDRRQPVDHAVEQQQVALDDLAVAGAILGVRRRVRQLERELQRPDRLPQLVAHHLVEVLHPRRLPLDRRGILADEGLDRRLLEDADGLRQG